MSQAKSRENDQASGPQKNQIFTQESLEHLLSPNHPASVLDTHWQKECIAGINFELLCLVNLEKTIDKLFLLLEQKYSTRLVEDLCPYFGCVWSAARALTHELITGQHQFSQKTFLEIGCGLALPSIWAHENEAIVTALDFHPSVPHFLKANLERRQLPDLRYVSADWHSLDFDPLGDEEFDFVVASDVLYEKTFPATVAAYMRKHVKAGGCAIMADPGRPYWDAFLKEISHLAQINKLHEFVDLATPHQQKVNVVKIDKFIK